MQTNSPSPVSKKVQSRRAQFAISSHVIPGLIASIDSIVILLSALISSTFVVYSGDANYYAAATAFVWLGTILLMNFAGLYEFDAVTRPLIYADKIVIVFATTFLFLLAAAFSLKISNEFSRIWTGSFALSAQGRLSLRLRRRRPGGLCGGIRHSVPMTPFRGRIPSMCSNQRTFAESQERLPVDVNYCSVLGTIDDIPSYVRSNDVDDVVICLPWSADEQISAILNMLRELPVNVYLGADLIGFRLPVRSAPDHFEQLPLVEIMGRPLSGWGFVQKTILDYCLGIILTILLLPLMILIVFAIRLESEGPALFRQERYGFVNRTFNIYKFRTMKYTGVVEDKIVQATREDPRVTRMGRVLRRLSLDELPQLFNVLNGTMSLVGPRPHAIQHNEEYARLIRGYFARHRVKPGMTGWAQVNGFRGETKTLDQMEARVQFDTYYVENWSLLLDLKILLMTAIICVAGRKAY